MPMEIAQVKRGIIVRHHSGGVYLVLHIANNSVPETENFPHCVVYQNVDTGAVWSRPIRDWVQKFDLVATAGGWWARFWRGVIIFSRGRGGGARVIAGNISNSTIIQGDVRGWK